MLMNCRVLSLTVLAAGLTLTSLSADDWPQFLGPNRDSASPEKVSAWKGDLKVEWKQKVGEAHSSPVVADDTVYVFYKPRGKYDDALAAFDAVTGDKKWENSYTREKFVPPFGTGPRGTPTVNDGKVYTLGNTGVLARWDAKTGEIDWKVDTLAEFKAKNLFFGVSTSPTVIDGKVIIMVGGNDAGIVAFDAVTGKPAWKATSDPASYASPLPIDGPGGKQLVFLTGSHLRSLDYNGKELWAVPFTDRLNESSTTPVKLANQILGSSVTAGAILLSLKEADGSVKAETVWKNPTISCYFSTPVVVGDYIYAVVGAATLVNPQVKLQCIDPKTGKVLWTEDRVGKYHAALLKTGDNKLLLHQDNGELALFDPNPDSYKELCRSKVCGSTWAHPALANGRLYVRDENELICIKLNE